MRAEAPSNYEWETVAFAARIDDQNLMKYDWYIDSGASRHMSPVREWFTTYRKIEPQKVYMGDHKSAIGIGVGTIKMCVEGGRSIEVQDVLHVPQFTASLLSIGTL